MAIAPTPTSVPLQLDKGKGAGLAGQVNAVDNGNQVWGVLIERDSSVATETPRV